MFELQLSDPALDDAILCRFPDAETLVGICDVSMQLGEDFVRRAHDEQVLSADFTGEHLLVFPWLSVVASPDAAAFADWTRTLFRAFEDAWL